MEDGVKCAVLPVLKQRWTKNTVEAILAPCAIPLVLAELLVFATIGGIRIIVLRPESGSKKKAEIQNLVTWAARRSVT